MPCLASGLGEVGLETAAALAGLALRRGAAERECLLSRTVEPPEGHVPPDAGVGRGAESREVCAALEGWAGGSQAEKWWSKAGECSEALRLPRL